MLLNERLHLTRPLVVGGAMSYDNLGNLLHNTYHRDEKQVGKFKVDKSLSGERVTVYHNPNNGRAIIAHKGTQSATDWATNAASLFGLDKYTPRYRYAQDIQNKTEAKYGANRVTTTGHSLGARVAQEVGKNSKKIITYNKPVLPTDILRPISKKQTDIRTRGDPLSVLAPLQLNQKRIKTIDTGSLNPLYNHSTKALIG